MVARTLSLGGNDLLMLVTAMVDEGGLLQCSGRVETKEEDRRRQIAAASVLRHPPFSATLR